MLMLPVLLLAQTLSPTAPAAPRPADPPCTEEDRRLPDALAGWSSGPTAANGAALPIERPVRVALDDARRVGFARPPERAPAPGSRGAAVAVEVAQAGRYQVALSGPAWIDMVGTGGPVASATHGHGPRCSGIRKIVGFDLPAGRHLLQLSGTEARDIVVMVAPAGRPTVGRR